MSLNTAVRNALLEAQIGLTNLLNNEVVIDRIGQAGITLAETFRSGGQVFSCGNGGSMCDAMHFAEELSGRFRQDRPALAASSISDPSHLSCVANDYGYEFVFSRYLEAHGKAGDTLVAISTSGRSKNVLNAIAVAKQKRMKVIGMTGKEDCPMASDCDILLATPAGSFADRVQELHIKMIHIMIELVERQMFAKNYP